MSIEVLPLGVRCNLSCPYCYQEPIRVAENEGHPKYDMAAMKKTLLKEGYEFSLFGGEPLLVSLKDLEELFAFGQEHFSKVAKKRERSVNAIQTNATLMTEAHIDLFKKYEVGVGISLDGPGVLNNARWAGNIKSTLEATAHSQSMLEELLRRKHAVSLIVTLHKLNASAEVLPSLVLWLRDLAEKGLRHVNLHFLEVDMIGIRESHALTQAENVAALLACARLMSETPLRVSPLDAMEKLMRGDDKNVNCMWNACDPYTTSAVRGVNGQGELGNCGRMSKEGPFWLKAATAGYERNLALYYTAMDAGGCKGCRFFSMCKGYCPGEGEGADWRSKTEHCGTLIAIFEALEAEMLRKGEVPLSLAPDRSLVESRMLDAWMKGRNLGLTAARDMKVSAGDVPHQDAPHGDAPHVDHNDNVNPHVTHSDHGDGGVQWNQL